MTAEPADTPRNPLLGVTRAIKRIGPIWRRSPRRFFLLSQHRRFRRRISFRRRGFRWRGFTWDEDVTWSMYAHGDYQGEERRALAGWMRRNGYLKPGRDLVVEVGANIGTTSLPLARDHGCRVLAIEPEPENFALLEANVRNNGLEGQILCESVAVAERSGAGNVLIPVDTSGGVELAEASAVGPPLGSAEIRGVEPVRTAPLSELLREHRIDPSTIAFVWSDAQGSDGHVIATAPELWAAGVPLYMELWPAALRRHGTDDVVADAVRYGFAAFIQSDRLIAHETPAPRPIGELTRLMERLSGREQTDVLLIP